MAGTDNRAPGKGSIEDGKRLVASGEWPAACALFTSIIESIDEGGGFSPADMVEAYQQRGYALCRMSRFKESVSDYMRARDIAKRSEDRAKEAESLSGLGYVHYVMGDPNMAMEFYEKAYAMLAEKGDTMTIGKLLIELGNVHNQAGRQEMAIKKYREALKRLSGLGPNDQIARAHYNIGDSLMKLKKEDEAAVEFERTLDMCRRIGTAFWNDWARTLLALCHAKKGRAKQAREALGDAIDSLQNRKDLLGLSQAIMVSGVISSVDGDFDKAFAEMDKAITIARDSGHVAMVAEALQEKGEVYARKGDKEAARRTLEGAKATYKDVGNDHAASEVDRMIHALDK